MQKAKHMARTKEYTVDRDFLTKVPIPAQTETYKPVSHGSLISLTIRAIKECGFNLEREVYSASADGNVANGKYLIRFGNDSDISIMIAWQNSYNKKVSLKFAIGTWVFVCENGNVSGDMGAFKSKHIGDVQEVTPERIREYICQAAETFYDMVKVKDEMKDIAVSERLRAEIIGRMFILEEVITSTQLNIIKREFKEPTHDYDAPGSAWEFYNYCTFALKDSHPRYWLEAQQYIYAFFVKEFHL